MLHELHEELRGYPGDDQVPAIPDAASRIALPLRYRHDESVLSFISTMTVFGIPLDVTAAGLAVEGFFPTDSATARPCTPLPTPERLAV